MRTIFVTPQTFQSALGSSVAGDVLQLGAGMYDQGYCLENRLGSATAPIVIEPAPWVDPNSVILSHQQSAAAYRPIANQIAKARQEAGKYPGLWDEAHKAHLRIIGCKHVIVRGLQFENSWPTHVLIDQSSNISVERCSFTDATFCIVAQGRHTYEVTVDGCAWTQDRVPNRIWSGIAWKRIHGHPDHKGCPWPVQDDDYRLFDGDFFRAVDIPGGVTVRNCIVKNAFNGVHAEGNGNNRETNRDFHIHHNRFIQIRDNAVEPEENAFNWSIHDNLFIDNHAPFSFSCKDLSHLYIFSNMLSYRSLQGSQGASGKFKDCNRGGKVFKLKGTPLRPHGPNYVVHNSMVTRLKYMPKGIFEGLQHYNNAIQFVAHAGAGFDEFPSVFGSPSKPHPDGRFTTRWSADAGYGIKMNGDVVSSPNWPNAPRKAGYLIGQKSIGANPQFVCGEDPVLFSRPTDFATDPNGPCARTAMAFEIEQPDGSNVHIAAGQDVGAIQRDAATGALSTFQGPQFMPTISKALIG